MDKIIECSKKKWKMMVSFVIMIFLSQFLIQYKETIWPKLYILIVIIATILILIFTQLDKPEFIVRNTFVIIFVLGTTSSLIMPVRQNLDENTHYFRSLLISDGKLRVEVSERDFLSVSPDFLGETKLPSISGYGNNINTNLYHKDFLNMKHIESDYKKEVHSSLEFNNPAYIPSALGIKIGNMISGKVSVAYYMGRIFNVLFYGSLATMAVFLSKSYKIQLFTFSTLPFVVWISSGFSYDSLYYGFTLLVFAKLGNFLSGDTYLTKKNLLLYEITCLPLVFAKGPVVLLALLPLFFPLKLYKSVKDYIVTFLFICLTGAISALWIFQKSFLNIVELMSKTSVKSATQNYSGLANRMEYFIAHPKYTLGLMLRSISDILSNTAGIIKSPHAYGTGSGSMETINFIIFIVLLIFASYQVRFITPKSFKIGFLCVFVFITLAIFYAISGDSRVFSLGDLTINGVQGRYHYYFLVGLPLLLSPLIHKYVNKTSMQLNERQINIFIMKLSTLLLFLNTCSAMYSYL